VAKIPRFCDLNFLAADVALLDVPGGDVTFRHTAPELLAAGFANPVGVRDKAHFPVLRLIMFSTNPCRDS
jgi:hypothetical protein